MLTLDRLCDIALELPGTQRGTSWGTPSVLVGKKALFHWHPKHQAIVFGMDFERRDLLIEADPETFFTTDHHRGWPCILARPNRLDEEWVRDFFRGAWRSMAPKKLLKEYGDQVLPV